MIALSKHAREQATRRGLSEEIVLAVARAPEQRLVVRTGRELRQSRVAMPTGGTLCLIRVWVARAQVTVVTVYRTSKIEKYWSRGMKVNYDAKTDTLTVVFRDVPVAESDEDKPGVILDYDATGNIVSIEVLDDPGGSKNRAR